ncbi:glucokinase [Pontibacter ummariensis]|uniref:Glucokinase n=1 Tax=Pontibacter ummariensis TaxID=1610492 RepID=A0A239G554_9BACT|nr:ROK family protein [Pontibacter ummariensis]PRY11632.1 glucokinase [Pontibacter ummariensis]SNS64297.1 glucokinase [Pontibacter ummariensis]
MNNSQQYAIGVDIGGTNTKYGIVNHRGDITHNGRMSTSQYLTAESFVEALFTALRPAIEEVGVEHIKGIGIGAPNANYFTGSIEHAPNLNWKGIVPFAGLISEKFGLPCTITNDANAAALGEMMYGAAKGMKDFIVMTLGTGVGSGIVTGGQLIYGHDGFAGELGHTIIRPGGRQHWSTGLYGSLEAYASATGIVLTAKEMLAETDQDSLLRRYPAEALDSKAIYECAMEGDEIAKEVYRFTGQILGESLANFVMFSSPEAIVLFGGVTKAGDLIMNPVREHMEKNLLAVFRNKVTLTFSELKEADAAILGASALVWSIRKQGNL